MTELLEGADTPPGPGWWQARDGKWYRRYVTHEPWAKVRALTDDDLCGVQLAAQQLVNEARSILARSTLPSSTVVAAWHKTVEQTPVVGHDTVTAVTPPTPSDFDDARSLWGGERSQEAEEADVQLLEPVRSFETSRERCPLLRDRAREPLQGSISPALQE
jgi:hypothetical protein